MKDYKMLAQSVDYGGLRLKNPIIFAPTTMGLREQEYLDKLEAIAKGGCAMIVIGDVPVLPGPMGPFSKSGFKRYSRIAEVAHRHGCKVCAQLHQNDTHFSGMFKYVPRLLTGKMKREDLRPLLNQQTGKYISSLPVEKVREITSAFGPAAEQVVKAGFDMVQVHGDRMCGSFSSSLFNHRTDEYGGSAEARTRFAVEAVESIRQRLPNLPIDYKLAVRQEDPHYGNAGVLEEELGVFVPALERAGVTSFHVTLADHGKLEDTIPPHDHPAFSAEGCFLPFCDQVRAFTSLPLCGVGGLSDPDFVEAQLASGRIQCAAMSRQLIADPEWPNKVRDGRAAEIRRCCRCNKKCLGGMYDHTGVHCIYDKGE